jgi:hypothetical protein
VVKMTYSPNSSPKVGCDFGRRKGEGAMKSGECSEEQIMTVPKQMEAVRMGVPCQN